MKTNSKKPAVRSTRQKTTRKRGGAKRGGSFLAGALFVLVIALAYFFAGDYLFPQGSRGVAVPAATGEIIVSFIDVGQGDAVLLRSVDNAILIDAGDHRARNIVLDYLREAGVSRLCYVVATHPHADHIGGMVQVLRDLEIGRVLMPDVTNDTDTFEFFLEAIENNNIPVTIPEPGDVFRAGIIVLTTKGPAPGRHSNINNASLVMRMEHGATSFLFTGDAETAAENWMVANAPNLRSTVLDLGHHGSRTSNTEAFLDAVAPDIAVIQVGANNRFGHPSPEVIERLEARGVAIYRTDELGTIRMITDGQTIQFP